MIKNKIYVLLVLGLMTLLLASCSSIQKAPRPLPLPLLSSSEPIVDDAINDSSKDAHLQALLDWDDAQTRGPAIEQARSYWEPQRWRDLPGLSRAGLLGVWPAWQSVCTHPSLRYVEHCQSLDSLMSKDENQQLEWLFKYWQPMRVRLEKDNDSAGQLTGYYEPYLFAQRWPDQEHQIPLYRWPKANSKEAFNFTRAEIENDENIKTSLEPFVIGWMKDPIDALILHIQGSGRIAMTESDGQVRLLRWSFAGHNGQPYRSVIKPLLDQKQMPSGSWESFRQWASVRSLAEVKEQIQINPRVIFFQEQVLSDPDQGPKGSHATPLVAGRSIAVDRLSIPLGQPVWLSSVGPKIRLHRLVMAQDTGAAIVGAVRADYFAGWDDVSYQVASQLKQALYLWTLVPRAP